MYKIYIYELNPNFDKKIFEYTAESGSLRSLKFLYKKWIEKNLLEAPFSEEILIHVKNVKILIYLHKKGIKNNFF